MARTVKDMPVRYLQNINGQNFEFLYQLDRCRKQLILLPQVMFCLRQFSEIIEELCQKRWIDYIRKNSTNAAGSREGDGVYIKYRSYNSTYSINRWSE